MLISQRADPEGEPYGPDLSTFLSASPSYRRTGILVDHITQDKKGHHLMCNIIEHTLVSWRPAKRVGNGSICHDQKHSRPSRPGLGKFQPNGISAWLPCGAICLRKRAPHRRRRKNLMPGPAPLRASSPWHPLVESYRGEWHAIKWLVSRDSRSISLMRLI